MPGKLIDTNVLVYAYDTSEGGKHTAAKDLLRLCGSKAAA